MPDLHAINLHLQKRLERDWHDEVRAEEAARWLDATGLLRNYKNGLPLRRLLRAGRIAGQEQRPNRKNGAWFIRRLAASRHPDAIREAREQLRYCLPIDRANFPADWPVNQGPAAFWQELGEDDRGLRISRAHSGIDLLCAPRHPRTGEGLPGGTRRRSHVPMGQADYSVPGRSPARPYLGVRSGSTGTRPGPSRRTPRPRVRAQGAAPMAQCALSRRMAQRRRSRLRPS